MSKANNTFLWPPCPTSVPSTWQPKVTHIPASLVPFALCVLLSQPAPTHSTKHVSSHPLPPVGPSLTHPHHHHSCGVQNTQQAVTATGWALMSQQQFVLAMGCDVLSC